MVPDKDLKPVSPPTSYHHHQILGEQVLEGLTRTFSYSFQLLHSGVGEFMGNHCEQ